MDPKHPPAAVDRKQLDATRQKQLAIIRGQFRDFARKKGHVELVERALLMGESTRALTEERGLTHVNARTIVHRARRYLGIDGRYRPLL